MSLQFDYWCYLNLISSSMKLLSLLTLAIVLIGITTLASACNYERMSRTPNYAKLTTPTKVLNIPNAHGVCVAPNGIFAVVSWTTGKVYLYYSCGKLMKVVDAILTNGNVENIMARSKDSNKFSIS